MNFPEMLEKYGVLALLAWMVIHVMTKQTTAITEMMNWFKSTGGCRYRKSQLTDDSESDKMDSSSSVDEDR